MTRQYWIIVDEQPTGPYTREQLAALGTLRRDTRVWYESLTDWIEAAQVADLAPLFAAPDGMPVIPDDSEMPEIPATGAGYGTGYGTGYAASTDMPSACAGSSSGSGFSTGSVNVTDGSSGHVTITAASTCDACGRPANYLVWSIICIVAFNTILGVIALISSLSVNRHYKRGYYDRAVRASERTQWWIICSIVLGLIFLPLRMAIFGV